MQPSKTTDKLQILTAFAEKALTQGVHKEVKTFKLDWKEVDCVIVPIITVEFK